MKKILFYLLYSLFLSNTLIAQEKDRQIIIHPLIGEKLDWVEEDYFKFFPNIDSLNEAVFYLNPDSTLNVNIKYETNGMVKDTLIGKYASLKLIEQHIERVVYNNMIEDEGSRVTLALSQNVDYSEQLFTTDENYIYTVNVENVNQNQTNLLTLTSIKSVNKITVHQSGALWNYMLIGMGGGAVLGLGIGFAISLGDNTNLNREWEGLSDMGRVFSGLMIGMLTGFVAGTIVGLVSMEDDVIIEPNTPSGLAELKKFTLYPNQSNE